MIVKAWYFVAVLAIIGVGSTGLLTSAGNSRALAETAAEGNQMTIGLVEQVNQLSKAMEEAKVLEARLKMLESSPRVVATGMVSITAVGNVDGAAVPLKWDKGIHVFLTVEASGDSTDDQMPLAVWNRTDDGFRIVIRNAIGNVPINRCQSTVNVQWVAVQSGHQE